MEETGISKVMKQTAPLCARRRKRRPFTGIAASCAAALAFMALVGPAAGQNLPFNYTSHSPQFMERLFTERVWVWRKEAGSPGERSVAAYAFFPDGRLSQCLGLKLEGGERWRPVTSNRWRAGRSITAGTMLALHAPFRKPKPFWTPVFYSPATGAVWTETNSRFWVGRKRNWTVLDLGWVQEGWPAAFRDVCPDLPLPPGMKIEERQTALDWEALRKQAPDAIVRHFPGSTATSPGRTGLGRSYGSPTTSVREVRAWLARHEGEPVDHVSGRVVEIGPEEGGVVRRVRVLSGPDGVPAVPEDAGQMTWQEDGSLFIRIPGFRLELVPRGYPLPFLPHDDRSWRRSFVSAPALNRAGEPDGGTAAADNAANRTEDGTPQAAPASGTARCIGDHEGIAIWSMGADGKRVWDTSGCRPVGGGKQQ